MRMLQTVFTIGHSNHSQEHFVSILLLHGITALCDVRSKPYSRMNPQFNREMLEQLLPKYGIKYVYLGNELGGRSEDPALYKNGKVAYDHLARTSPFQRGLDRVQKGAQDYRIALMCAEKEPLECHRTILVSRHLAALGLDVQHIHGDGGLESHAAAITRLRQILKVPEEQTDMFRSHEDLVAAAYRRQEERIAFEIEPIADGAALGSAAK